MQTYMVFVGAQVVLLVAVLWIKGRFDERPKKYL
jgi:hypothetical protein